MSRITLDPLALAWLWLTALSMAATAAALAVDWGLAREASGAAILILSGAKARLILGRYLGLAATPGWRRGFDLCMGLFLVLLLTLYLVAPS